MFEKILVAIDFLSETSKLLIIETLRNKHYSSILKILILSQILNVVIFCKRGEAEHNFFERISNQIKANFVDKKSSLDESSFQQVYTDDLNYQLLDEAVFTIYFTPENFKSYINLNPVGDYRFQGTINPPSFDDIEALGVLMIKNNCSLSEEEQKQKSRLEKEIISLLTNNKYQDFITDELNLHEFFKNDKYKNSCPKNALFYRKKSLIRIKEELGIRS